jgi:hypothetical protein
MSARLRFRSRKRSVSESLRRGNLIGVAVMKTMKIQIFALFTFFIFTNAAQAVDLDDMGVTIQMIESEDMKEVSKELSLPDVASEVAKQHMEEHDFHDRKRDAKDDGRKDHHEGYRDERDDSQTEVKDEIDDHHDEAKEDIDDSKDGSDDSKDQIDDSKDQINDSTDDSKNTIDDSKDGIMDDTMPIASDEI